MPAASDEKVLACWFSVLNGNGGLGRWALKGMGAVGRGLAGAGRAIGSGLGEVNWASRRGFVKLPGLGLVDDVVGGLPARLPNFKNKTTAKIHWRRHAHNFTWDGSRWIPYKDAADLPQYARSFDNYVYAGRRLGAGFGNGVVSGVGRNGRTYFYDSSTGNLAIVDRHDLVTFFHPDDGIEYFFRQL